MTTEEVKNEDGEHQDNDELQDARDANLRQFVTFFVGSEHFAVDIAPVQEIIRLPEVVRVPLAPPTLEGLANLRGKVLPIVSLRRIFGFAECPYDDATRAVVINSGQPLGFVVDRIARVMEVEIEHIEGVDSISCTVSTDFLSGIIKDAGGHAMIMVLDFTRIIAREFPEIAATAQQASVIVRNTDDASQNDAAEGDELQLVSFQIAGQEYALPIHDVQEIVRIPEELVHVPHTQRHVIGVMTLRNRLLPLVSLRQMFDLPGSELTEQSRVVVVSRGAALVGVIMDSVNEVLRVTSADVESLPGMLACDDNLSEITDICRLNKGTRLVSIISAENLFSRSAQGEALPESKCMSGEVDADTVETTHDDDEQLVLFRLDKEEFGISINSVQEIVRIPEELTHIPKAPNCVEGVINLRGSVLPVIDLRRRLSIATVERSDQQRVLVLIIDSVRTGFIVDSVTEVLSIRKNAFITAPYFSSEQSKLLARMANLEEQHRMVQLIEPDQLIEGSDVAALARISA